VTVPRRVVFLLAPGVHVLDLAGPAQAFCTAGDLAGAYRVSYVAETESVMSAQGLALSAGRELPTLRSDDLIFVPGWRSGPDQRRPPFGPDCRQWLRDHHARGGRVASVCSGAAALGAVGLLDGRRFTTHHDLADALAAHHPRAQLVRDVLYVSDGGVLTSAGIASGIDLALAVIAADHGPRLTARVAREMVVTVRRNGSEPQASSMLTHRDHLSDIVHHVQNTIDERFAARLALSELAAECAVSERTLTRAFVAATGLTPLRYQQALRREHAERLISHGTSVEAAAHAVGFNDARMLRRLRSQARGATAGGPAASRYTGKL
jgi:transcriptional regulator GlxA family with amidase domain